MALDLGTLFGVAGLVVALISLVYVRTQAAASRVQAEAAREQLELARRLAALDVSMRLSERTFDIRRDLLDSPVVQEQYYQGNPGLREIFEGAGGMGAVLTMRKMLDTFQEIYLLRQEGVVTDAHWRNWIAAFRPFTRMTAMRALFENAKSRGIYAGEFQTLVHDIFEGRDPQDPAPALGRR
ncbi:MAG TPA: hypothetical protein VMT50_10480 [Steroidobacteraceae bacterium]|nr:hypothetical protein [Steroidobacteraceae bacterium]